MSDASNARVHCRRAFDGLLPRRLPPSVLLMEQQAPFLAFPSGGAIVQTTSRRLTSYFTIPPERS